ncbi:DUF4163 domain-containing protein [Sphingosinicella sp. LHD-64]|uniref:PdaC/SigV domain-containing protein n=1 Tax=Sphingosinicella sp. LHD-64 TaxID=3072139 RepID=UPI00280E490F|nr:DUF4163 domain-containing protein [Sphingosinicella sp. LHD-64]MDQ8756410.1 DUF4163 domain-containing protein [Sphingosinicella sp. LHD-64]
MKTDMIVVTALLALAAQPGDFNRTEETELLEFSYAWPAEAVRDPALNAILEERMEAARFEARRTAEEDRRTRPAEAPFNAHHYGESWIVDGDTPRLLSLSSSASTYTGGAHSNLLFAAMLWDKQAHRVLDTPSLFGSALAGLGDRYCAALVVEREERRGEPTPQGDLFGDCPGIDQQVLAPADRDRNGRFDTLRILLPPYAAGPYVEGDYVIDVAFGDADLAAIEADYRPAFEVPGPDFRPVSDEAE